MTVCHSGAGNRLIAHWGILFTFRIVGIVLLHLTFTKSLDESFHPLGVLSRIATAQPEWDSNLIAGITARIRAVVDTAWKVIFAAVGKAQMVELQRLIAAVHPEILPAATFSASAVLILYSDHIIQIDYLVAVHDINASRFSIREI